MNVKIEPSWHQALASEWESPYFSDLARFVHEQYRTHTIYPPARKIFAAFDACPFNDVKVVILGQDPYHGPGQANGLCFWVSHTAVACQYLQGDPRRHRRPDPG